MKKYIEADKLVVQIKGIIAAVEVKKHPDEFGSIDQCMSAAEIEALNLVLDCIKELQQEQPKEDLEKIEKASYEVFPVKKKLGVEIKYPNREDKNFSKRKIWKDGVIWAIYELGLNARKEE